MTSSIRFLGLFVILLAGLGRAEEFISENLEDFCKSYYTCSDVNSPYLDQQLVFYVNEDSEFGKGFRTKAALSFVNSTMANFPWGVLQAAEVAELDMSNCSIQKIAQKCFEGSINLFTLNLSNNKLEEIPASTFILAPELRDLSLEGNKISRLYSNSFEKLRNLRYLNLDDNEISELPTLVFRDLKSLQILSLSRNRLKHLSFTYFATNHYLSNINLSQNKLESILPSLFRRLRKVAILNLTDNPNLHNLRLNLNGGIIHLKNCNLQNLRIYGKISSLYLDNNRLNSTSFFIQDPTDLTTLSLANNSLKDVKFLENFEDLEILELQDNPGLNLIDVDFRGKYLELLNLRNCNLYYFPINLIYSNLYLANLDISHNKISNINPSHFQKLQKVRNFKIHANPWNCFSLNRLMDELIKRRLIIYTKDRFNENFVGEYKEGIACMYRHEEENSQETDLVYPLFLESYQESTTLKSLDDFVSEQNQKLEAQIVMEMADYNQNENTTDFNPNGNEDNDGTKAMDMEDLDSEMVTEETTSETFLEPKNIDFQDQNENLLEAFNKKLEEQNQQLEQLQLEVNQLNKTISLLFGANRMIFQYLKDHDERLKGFEQLNQTFWNNAAVIV